MKKIINSKKIVLFTATLLLVLGCNINAIPTYVSKDISLGVITVNGLQDVDLYAQNVTIDLSKLISDEQFEAIETAKLKSITLTLNNDYENSVTNSRDFESASIGLYELEEGQVIVVVPSVGGVTNVVRAIAYTSFTNPMAMKSGVPFELEIEPSDGNIIDLIKNKKVTIGIAIKSSSNFNDNAFSFSAKVETEILVE